MWVVVLLVIVAFGGALSALIGWAGASPRSIAVVSATAYTALLGVVAFIGLEGTGCGENGALWFHGGTFVLSVLILGPPAAWLFQGGRIQAIAYVVPAFFAALVLAGLGLLVVLATGLGGCR